MCNNAVRTPAPNEKSPSGNLLVLINSIAQRPLKRRLCLSANILCWPGLYAAEPNLYMLQQTAAQNILNYTDKLTKSKICQRICSVRMRCFIRNNLINRLSTQQTNNLRGFIPQ